MTIGQAGFGLYQTVKGGIDARNNERPVYEIPESMRQAMDTSERMAQRGLDEQTRQNYLQGLVDTRAAAFQGLSDRKAGIGAVAGVQQREIAGQQQLAAMDNEQRMRNIAALQDMRMRMANFEDKEFEINQMQPYQDRAAAASAMQGAGLQNVFGAAESYAKMEMSGYNQQQRDIRDMKQQMKADGTFSRPAFRAAKSEMNKQFYQGLNNPYSTNNDYGKFMDNSSQNNSFFSNNPVIQNGLNNSTFNTLSQGVQRMLTDDLGYSREELQGKTELELRNIIQENIAR